VDGAGNLVIADTSNALIRVAAARTGTFYGQAGMGGKCSPKTDGARARS
jgi:hypothetical protein